MNVDTADMRAVDPETGTAPHASLYETLVDFPREVGEWRVGSGGGSGVAGYGQGNKWCGGEVWRGRSYLLLSLACSKVNGKNRTALHRPSSFLACTLRHTHLHGPAPPPSAASPHIHTRAGALRAGRGGPRGGCEGPGL